jgi:molecular chaperone DnaK (HSP70)
LGNHRYIIGIDLGTTNCVLAYTESDASPAREADIRVLRIPQVVSPGEVGEQVLLPSCLFLPGPHDVPAGGLVLPWSREEPDFSVGAFARTRGTEIPHRLVSSAKSWLCHDGVDRTQPILPWDSPEEARRVSPVEASARLLEHLRDAWNHEMAADDPEARLEAQELFITVPASFDAVARELTVQAARSAGLEHFTLLEEPQAAFYAWLESQKEGWRDAVNKGDSILVCDVGGGTTDFSLIVVTEQEGNLALKRVAVGDHILLGGDNMDLTLAHLIRAKLPEKSRKLDAWQFRGLWHSCQAAKERLLGDSSLESEPIVILGRGSSLIGGTLRTELTRKEAESVLLDGFLPLCESSELPKQGARVGMREMGLPYEPDPAITRHLARFLARQARGSEVEDPGGSPTAVLFNGGVMKAPLIRDRVLSALRSWEGENEQGESIRELPAADLDLAVARGAAYYGLARRGRGIRIRAGTARAYYIGIESAMPSVPGVPTPLKALCVVPFGMEEGSEASIREKEFGIVLGEPAEFRLLASTTRRQDHAGEVVEDWDEQIDEVTTMKTLLPPAEAQEEGGNMVPVWLQSKVTEVGSLELWCVAREDQQRWKLEFNLRERETKP